MNLLLTRPDRSITGEITLPSSKSISNRVLIINALSYSSFPVKNLSDCDDSVVMNQVLESNTNRFDIGHAGTAMRFLTAYLSKIVGEWYLTGSGRMQQRPIAILVDALRQMGALIEYTGVVGFPPLKITGTALKGGTIELDGSVSSQYISALLMIAPTVQGGLTLRLKNKITSRSYIEMTLQLMKKFGIRHQWSGNEIRIEAQAYKPVPYTVEADWSAASYWYAMAVLSEQCDLYLKGLYLNSTQGDAIQATWFEKYFGLRSRQEGDTVRLTKGREVPLKQLNLNFIENPDIAQTWVVLAIGKQLPFYFTGLKTLKIKETDRISALKNECAKLGAILTEPAEGELTWDGQLNEALVQKEPVIATYHDHRMAMAFAPVAQFNGAIRIEDAMVVTKSYPSFYDDLRKAGFGIKEVTP
ncbi:MAG: 3-phosphoshikimate 1-carboxyvinyltransferase [Bacteroidetes bacterium]|nr:3-phosphoshikimate 1-carboxyvinyltransferase [Bacteroidota bacterium]MCL6103263.1 3-phosphoshikimate 1-carboxyvinyltransferase [Bacteroidota bacterium]